MPTMKERRAAFEAAASGQTDKPESRKSAPLKAAVSPKKDALVRHDSSSSSSAEVQAKQASAKAAAPASASTAEKAEPGKEEEEWATVPGSAKPEVTPTLVPEPAPPPPAAAPPPESPSPQDKARDVARSSGKSEEEDEEFGYAFEVQIRLDHCALCHPRDLRSGRATGLSQPHVLDLLSVSLRRAESERRLTIRWSSRHLRCHQSTSPTSRTTSSRGAGPKRSPAFHLLDQKSASGNTAHAVHAA